MYNQLSSQLNPHPHPPFRKFTHQPCKHVIPSIHSFTNLYLVISLTMSSKNRKLTRSYAVADLTALAAPPTQNLRPAPKTRGQSLQQATADQITIKSKQVRTENKGNINEKPFEKKKKTNPRQVALTLTLLLSLPLGAQHQRGQARPTCQPLQRKPPLS